MNEVFKECLKKFVLVFVDDILIYNRSLEEHQIHLFHVLQILENQQLFPNIKKCKFSQTSLEYLGHIISDQGVAADDIKIQVMLDWPVPLSIKDLRGFLGLTGYYRRFVANYGSIAWPLTELLKKDNFKWGPQANATSQALKPAMSRNPILALPNFSRPFIVETNTSSIGIGAVLVRDKHPLAFFSHALPQHARLKSVYEHELIAVVRAIQKWRHYLLGRKFIVRTDQRSLKFLLLQRMVSPDNQKWLSQLLGYDFEIECKPGFTNKVADALSKIPAQATLLALSTPQVLQLSELDKELASDPSLSQILAALYTSHPAKPGYSLVQGRLYYKNILVVPPQSNLISLILYDCHDSAIEGHSGVLKALKRVSAMFY